MRQLVTFSCDAALGSAAPFWAAGLHVAVLAVFVAAWGDGVGVPVWSSWSFYTQLRVVELSLLAVLLPWTAARAMPPGDTTSRVRLSGLTGAPPSRLLLARAAGSLSVTAMVGLAAVPVAILAQRMSGGSLLRVAVHDGALLGLGATAVVMHLWVERSVGDPVKAWMLTTVVFGARGWAALRITSDPTLAAAVLFLGSAASLGWLMHRSDREDLYLPEPAA